MKDKTLRDKRILVDKHFAHYTEKDVKKDVRRLKDDISEGVKMVVKMYPHKSGEELASEISVYLNNKVIPRRFGRDLI